MRFGNSGGNNKGKKYLDRRNLDFDKLTAEDYIRLDDFNTWYIDNIELIEQGLEARKVFDADIVNDTYAEICETLLFAKTIIEDYMGYFSQAYFTNRTRAVMQKDKYVLVENENQIDCILLENDTSEDLKAINSDLISDILKYVKSNYPMNEHFLFYQYVNLEKRSYHALAMRTDRMVYEIQKIIRKIKLDIQSNMDLTSKRKQGQ